MKPPPPQTMMGCLGLMEGMGIRGMKGWMVRVRETKSVAFIRRGSVRASMAAGALAAAGCRVVRLYGLGFARLGCFAGLREADLEVGLLGRALRLPITRAGGSEWREGHAWSFHRAACGGGHGRAGGMPAPPTPRNAGGNPRHPSLCDTGTLNHRTMCGGSECWSKTDVRVWV